MNGSGRKVSVEAEDTSKESGPFFIVGCERSGTTLLRAMLNEHSQLAIPTESHFLIPLLEELSTKDRFSREEIERAFHIVTGHRRWQEWRCDEAQLYRKLLDGSHAGLADIIQTIFEQPLADSGKRRWGDKTPKYVSCIPELAEVLPQAKFIHIVRDGRDVCISYLRANWYDGWVEKIARHWRERIEEGRRAASEVGPEKYLEVRYEDLVRDPEKTLRDLCEFLGEEFEPQMLSYHNRGAEIVDEREKHLHQKLNRLPKSQDLERWKTELPVRKRLVFETFALPGLTELRYQVDHASFKRVVVFPAIRCMEVLLSKSARWRQKIGLSRSGLSTRKAKAPAK